MGLQEHPQDDAKDAVAERGARATLGVADGQLAYGVLRGAFGVNIFMHGAARLGSLSGFVDGVTAGFAETILPPELVRLFAWTIVPAELLIGLAILIGFKTRSALLGGSLLLLMLTIGVTLQQRWDTAGLQVTYFIVYALLIGGLGFNRWSVDQWRADRSAKDTP